MNPIPSHIGKYVVSGIIGRGGMGAVYRGTDPRLDRPVAIKVLHDLALAEAEVQQRFLQEARAAANLRHENIVTVYEVGEHSGFTYVAMEYVSGESLAAIARSRRSVPLRDMLGWIDQLCSGLSLAHTRGVVHRDIKPANLMVDEHGVLRILDFGIARIEGSTMTTEGALLGTLNYMSPEQVLGQRVDQRSDIFSVAATAYELLIGQQAFPGPAAAAIHRILNVDPPPPSSIRRDLPGELDEVIGRALAKDPARRTGDLRDMQRQIRAVRDRLDFGIAVQTEPVPVPVTVEPGIAVQRQTPHKPVEELTVAKPATPTPVDELTIVRPAPPTPVDELTVVKPAPPAPVDELTVVKPAPLTPVNEVTVGRSVLFAPVDEPTADTIVAPRWRWSRWQMIAGGVIAVALIGGLLGQFAGNVRSPSPTDSPAPRTPGDLKVLIERGIAPHFTEDIRQDIVQRFGPNDLENGLLVETTLIPELQEAANAAVARGISALGDVQGALVAIDNRTGYIRALVGGTARDTINRATRPRRIGSLFMPVVFAAAIDRGYTAVSMMNDAPVEYSTLNAPPYSPRNDDGKYRGPLTLRQAFEDSRNVVAARLMDSIDPRQVMPYARRLGLQGDFPSDMPLMAVSELEATLVEVTSVHATLANQGIRMEPQAMSSVVDLAGTIQEYRPQPQEAVRSDTAFIITNLLRGVIARGTGAAARTLDWPLAGKTGTVPDGTDGWFVGYDPNITVGVWVGRDDERPVRSKEAATSAALSIWTEFMRAYISARGDRANPPAFNAPGNIVFVPGDSGVTEAFILGTQPESQPGTSRPR